MIFAVLGSLGGVVAFLGAITIVVKAIFQQTGATKANTKALEKLTSTVTDMDARVDDHGIRIVRLETAETIRMQHR